MPQQRRGYIDGQLLVAMPGMPDTRFAKSVIYICAHSDEGAMGLIINQTVPDIVFPDLLVQLNVIQPDQKIMLSPRASHVPVLRGGPVETGRGFVLHSGDYHKGQSTVPMESGICLTSTLDILKAVAHDEGPSRAVLALGYAGWAPGQLESEIQNNGWINCDADPDLVFDTDNERKYERVLATLGIAPGMLSEQAGHA